MIVQLRTQNVEKLLRVIIDRKLNFKKQVTNLCNKASKKSQEQEFFHVYQ